MSDLATTPSRARQRDRKLTEEQLAKLVTGERPYKVFWGR